MPVMVLTMCGVKSKWARILNVASSGATGKVVRPGRQTKMKSNSWEIHGKFRSCLVEPRKHQALFVAIT